MERDPFGRPLERDPEDGEAELVLPGLVEPEAAEESRDLPSIDTAAFAGAALGSRWAVGNDGATLRGIALWRLEHPPASPQDVDDAPPGPWRQAIALLAVDDTTDPLTVRWEQHGAGADEVITTHPLTAAGAAWEAPLARALGYYTEAPWDGDREAATLELGKDEFLDVSVGAVVSLERCDGDAPPTLRTVASSVEVWHSYAKHEEKDAWLLCDADRTPLARYELGDAIDAPRTHAQRRFWRNAEIAVWFTWIVVVVASQSAVVFLVGALFAVRRLWGIAKRAMRRRAARAGG